MINKKYLKWSSCVDWRKRGGSEENYKEVQVKYREAASQIPTKYRHVTQVKKNANKRKTGEEGQFRKHTTNIKRPWLAIGMNWAPFSFLRDF